MSFELSKKFIAASEDMCGLHHASPAPYFRKNIFIDKKVRSAVLTVCGLGFYRFWLNGREYTRGLLSPYITNPDSILDYDRYDLGGALGDGKNTLAFQLGNGMQNAYGGFVWNFHEAAFRSAPKMAMRLSLEFDDGEICEYEADESFLTHPSPVLKDDLRMGEVYDASCEIAGWNETDFDDSGWQHAIKTETPLGTPVISLARPIVEADILKPRSITFGKWIPGVSREHHYGYIYDFGINTSGIITLKIKGKRGQKITLTFGELLRGGDFYTDNISFIRKELECCPDYVQQDIYICRGDDREEYKPSFTYHGFRYVFVEGITEEQAAEDLLTYNVMHTDLAERGSFTSSCDKLNRLQAMTRNATLSNFWHFPNDCPHREKNGWTADAALSAEHTLLNLDPYDNYREWMRHIGAALNHSGALPGIVPTGGWGFEWGNGPAWDQVIIELPYMSYRYTGKAEIITENIDAIMKYVRYLTTRVDKRGLIEIGLGDWCAPTAIKSPLVFTDSVISKYIADKAAFMAKVAGREADARLCEDFSDRLRTAVRRELIDLERAVAIGECQTSQAMAIYYGILDGEEKEMALLKLVEYIERDKGHIDTGVLGGRVLFHVLAEGGYADLAYEIMVEPTPPSYGYWLEQGYTSLAEDFLTDDEGINSKNHHFWGDISAFFIKRICGINYNPDGGDTSRLLLAPHFIGALDFASAHHDCPMGRICSEWKREGEAVIWSLAIPDGMSCELKLPKGYREISREEKNGSLLIRLSE